MAFGRPTKYNQDILSTALDYVTNYESYDDVIPSIAGLSIALGVHRDTIHTWAKDEDKKDFSDIIKLLSASQERRLLNGSLSNNLNPMISKLVLSKHGYTDKVEQDITSGGKALQHPGYSIVDK